ncbi:AAA family ATPase [Parasphingorhabdus sp. NYA22]|jgi:SpoVK/Ycf46/Vps4 family AAA+-type ATPase|nr:MAG: AAA family ATPase [Sphingopyxis sp.]|tara:strand:- start:166812 stop:167807 length:996 start_codon:yes stop_codon:yes gene_type:complete
MTNAKQIEKMLRSHAEGDDEQFFSIALQVAAAEARQGRRDTANSLRAAVDAARAKDGVRPSIPIAFASPRGDLEGLLDLKQPSITLADVILPSASLDRLNHLMLQQRKRDQLREHGKLPSNRYLFVGPPGSGKTMTAEAVAGELKLPLFVIRLDTLITRFMGETAAKLRLVFDEILRRRAVYLFDEFDAVGGHRAASNDVAEMRRVLNSFLQFMEEKTATDSAIIAATNHPELLDKALLRRFDEVLEFSLPTPDQIRAVIKYNLRPIKYPRIKWKAVEKAAEGLSQAEIARAASEAVKTAILAQRSSITTQDLTEKLEDRQSMRSAFTTAS